MLFLITSLKYETKIAVTLMHLFFMVNEFHCHSDKMIAQNIIKITYAIRYDKIDIIYIKAPVDMNCQVIVH